MTDFAEKPWFDVFDDYTGVHRPVNPRLRPTVLPGVALAALIVAPIMLAELQALPEVAAPPTIVVSPADDPPVPGVGPALAPPKKRGPDTRRHPAPPTSRRGVYAVSTGGRSSSSCGMDGTDG